MPKKIEKQATFKPTATLKFFIAIGVLQLLVITGAVITSLWLSTQSGDTVVGGSVVFGVLFSLLFIIAALLSPITLIGVPIYLIRKNQPENGLHFRLRRWWLRSCFCCKGYIPYLALLSTTTSSHKKQQILSTFDSR